MDSECPLIPSNWSVDETVRRCTAFCSANASCVGTTARRDSCSPALCISEGQQSVLFIQSSTIDLHCTSDFIGLGGLFQVSPCTSTARPRVSRAVPSPVNAACGLQARRPEQCAGLTMLLFSAFQAFSSLCCFPVFSCAFLVMLLSCIPFCACLHLRSPAGLY